MKMPAKKTESRKKVSAKVAESVAYDLATYRIIFAEVNGQNVSQDETIEYMLSAFMQGDKDFQKRKKARNNVEVKERQDEEKQPRDNDTSTTNSRETGDTPSKETTETQNTGNDSTAGTTKTRRGFLGG